MFSGSTDITTKEILKRYAELHDRPSNSGNTTGNGNSFANSSKGTAQGPTPTVGNAESSLPSGNAKPWSAETSFRIMPKQGQTPPSGSLPQPPSIPGANGFYSSSQHGSRDSLGPNGNARFYGSHNRDAYTPSPGPA